MEAEDGVIDNGGQSQTLDDLCKHFPDRIDAVFFFSIRRKNLQFPDIAVLVVASEDVILLSCFI